MRDVLMGDVLIWYTVLEFLGCFVLPFVGRLMYAIAFLLSPLSPSGVMGRSLPNGILFSPL
jgi:hypothetical protein